MNNCNYLLDGECQLFSKNCDNSCPMSRPDFMERLTHIATCQEEIIQLQKEVIDELFAMLSLHISVEAEEMRPLIEKINEAAKKRAEVQG